MIIRDRIYALADALGLTLELDKKSLGLTGEMTREVKLGALSLPVKMKAVSTQLGKEVYMLMVRCTGNLALLVTSKAGRAGMIVDLHILDLAKMDKIDGWLEKNNPASVNEALKMLGKAVVKSFVKETKDEWFEATAE